MKTNPFQPSEPIPKIEKIEGFGNVSFKCCGIVFEKAIEFKNPILPFCPICRKRVGTKKQVKPLKSRKRSFYVPMGLRIKPK